MISAASSICRSTAGAFQELSPEAKAVFAPRGAPPTPGEWIQQSALGKVISDVAERGPEAFYAGLPADSIRARLESLAGLPLTAAASKLAAALLTSAPRQTPP